VSVAQPRDLWRPALRIWYRLVRLFDPLVRAWLDRLDLGDTVDLLVVGRRTGRPRPVLVGLLDVDGRWYVGHPNGDVQWTRNLEAAGEARVRRRGLGEVAVRAVRLADGPERERAIRATFAQHPFPGNLIYRLAWGHIRRVGTFFRLEPLARPELSSEPAR
jgi:deazaflavin-dependent oxidoreductase (nitroreductase family)